MFDKVFPHLPLILHIYNLYIHFETINYEAYNCFIFKNDINYILSLTEI